MITILVTGAGGGVGQGVIKSLRLIKDLDIRIVAADMNPKATGVYAGDMAYLVSPCDSSNYFSSLAKIFKSENVSFYIPGTDVELKFCASNREKIQNEFGVKIVVSQLNTINITGDKYKTFEFLRENEFSHPKTVQGKDFESSSIEYPVIVKPAVGCRSLGVYKANNKDELGQFLSDPTGLIVQELVGDADSEYTCTVVNAGGDISPVLTLKRVLRSGDTFIAEPVQSAQISEYVQKVAKKLDIEGSCNFQLRLDRDNIPKIFEINCRFSGTTPFCAQLGFNPVEFYLKKSLHLKYSWKVDYDLMVLRHWSEVLVGKSMVEELGTRGKATPLISGRSNLFL